MSGSLGAYFGIDAVLKAIGASSSSSPIGFCFLKASSKILVACLALSFSIIFFATLLAMKYSETPISIIGSPSLTSFQSSSRTGFFFLFAFSLSATSFAYWTALLAENELLITASKRFSKK